MQTIQVLLDAGADHHAQEEHGRTPLMEAAARGHSEAVACLLRHPFTLVDKMDGSGATASLAAVRAGHVHVLRQLLDSSASLRVRNNAHRTLLHEVSGSRRRAYRNAVSLFFPCKSVGYQSYTLKILSWRSLNAAAETEREKVEWNESLCYTS